jgi:hypothetical protein
MLADRVKDWLNEILSCKGSMEKHWPLSSAESTASLALDLHVRRPVSPGSQQCINHSEFIAFRDGTSLKLCRIAIWREKPASFLWSFPQTNPLNEALMKL